ncbi:hypothetical protein [Rhizobium sp. CAU 1783]
MRRPALATADEAEKIMELWRSHAFDTHDIGRILDLHESVVARTIQAVRDMARMMAGGRT